MSQMVVTVFSVPAVSYALYGRDTVHVQLRLLAAIEILLNPELYDTTTEAYYAPYRADEGGRPVGRQKLSRRLSSRPVAF